jgi:hypothetical protein
MNINEIQANPDCSILRNYKTLCEESARTGEVNSTQPVKMKILEELLQNHQCSHPHHHTAEDCMKDID